MTSSRSHRSARVTVVLAALLALVLTGCADAIGGSGRGSAAPTPSLSPAPSQFPSTGSTPTGATSSSSAPTSTAPTTGSSPSGSTVPAALRRDPVTTAIGDPVTVDYCAGLGTRFLAPVGYEVVYAGTQYLSGCFWRLRKSGETQLDVTLYASPASQLPSKTKATYRTVNGQRVRVTPLDRTVGSCERDVFLSSGTPTVLTLLAFQIRIPKNSAKLCQAANTAAAAVTAKIKAKALKPVNLSADTVTDLDMCKVVEAGGIADSPLLAGSDPYRRYFGAECLVSGTKVKAYFDTALADPVVTQQSTPTKAGSHAILALNGNTNSNCLFSSHQGLLPDGVTNETIEFQFVSQSGKAIAGMCTTGKALIAKFLDTAGLR